MSTIQFVRIKSDIDDLAEEILLALDHRSDVAILQKGPKDYEIVVLDANLDHVKNGRGYVESLLDSVSKDWRAVLTIK